jgi:hypothetical protein
MVLGPASVPVVHDVALAQRDPELAVLSVMAHGHGPLAEVIGHAALAAADRLSPDRRVLYSDLVYAALSEAARAALEDLMANGNYVFQSDFAKTHQATGRAEGRAEAVLDVLDARGFAVSGELRARILACTDAAQLSAWLRKAATAVAIDTVF